jgi:hypothetical protein
MIDRTQIQQELVAKMRARGIGVPELAHEIEANGATLRRFLHGDHSIPWRTLQKVRAWLRPGGAAARAVRAPSPTPRPPRPPRADATPAVETPAPAARMGDRRGRPTNEDRITALRNQVAELAARVAALEAGRSA